MQQQLTNERQQLRMNDNGNMNKETERPRKRRMHLTLKSKQEICQRKQTNPTLTIETFAAEYGCDKTTVSKILKAKEHWLSIQLTRPEATKMTNRPAKFMELETALNTWSQQMLSQNAILTDGLLQLQAKKFMTLLDISEDDFKASNGWLDRFKKRHNIR